MSTRLETEVCSRCDGTGSYSYNAMTGSVCFKCRGAKRVFTKRGQVANEYLTKLRSKRVADLVIGDAIWMPGCPGLSASKWMVVLAVVPTSTITSVSYNGAVVDMSRRLDVNGDKHFLVGVTPEYVVRVRQTPEQAAATMEQAVAFQATLTKDGKVRAR